MPIILDNQLREQIDYDSVIFPISFFQDELITLDQWSGPLHWHPGFEIATAETGILDYQVGEQHLTLYAGDSVFVNGNILHGIKQLAGEIADPMPNIVFSGSLIAPESSQIYKNYIEPLLQCHDLPFILFRAEESINSVIRDIYRCFREKPTCYEMKIQRDINQLFEHIYLHLESFPRYKQNRIQLINQIRLQKMLDFIYTHYSEPISLNDLARAANVSRSEVGRCFKSFMNASPFEILIQHRLQMAHHLLADGIHTIDEVSTACGFNTVNYFRKQFKAKYGMTPGKRNTLGK